MSSSSDFLKRDLLKNLQHCSDYLEFIVKKLQEADDKPDMYFADTPEGRYVRDICNQAEDLLSKAKYPLKAIFAPVRAEGHLYKNSANRYEIEDGVYFTSGSPIEFLLEEPIDEDDYEPERWVRSRVEHHDGYYIVGYENIEMDGLYARIK